VLSHFVNFLWHLHKQNDRKKSPRSLWWVILSTFYGTVISTMNEEGAKKLVVSHLVKCLWHCHQQNDRKKSPRSLWWVIMSLCQTVYGIYISIMTEARTIEVSDESFCQRFMAFTSVKWQRTESWQLVISHFVNFCPALTLAKTNANWRQLKGGNLKVVRAKS